MTRATTDDNAVELLTVAQTAVLLNVSTRTVATLTSQGDLPSTRVGRSVRYLRSDVQRFLARNRS